MRTTLRTLTTRRVVTTTALTAAAASIALVILTRASLWNLYRQPGYSTMSDARPRVVSRAPLLVPGRDDTIIGTYSLRTKMPRPAPCPTSSEVFCTTHWTPVARLPSGLLSDSKAMSREDSYAYTSLLTAPDTVCIARGTSHQATSDGQAFSDWSLLCASDARNEFVFRNVRLGM